MTYTSQPTKNIGDPITYLDFNAVNINTDDHETRIGALELTQSSIEVFNGYLSNASSFTTLTGFELWQAPFNFTLTSAVVGIFLKGSLTGTLQVDVKKSPDRDPANFVTVFTTKPSILYSSAANYDDSTNAVFDVGQKDIVTGEWLRFDLTQVPTAGTISKLTFVLFGEL